MAINDTEIAILGGCGFGESKGKFYKDVFLFNTKDQSVKKVVEYSDGEEAFKSLFLSTALIG